MNTSLSKCLGEKKGLFELDCKIQVDQAVDISYVMQKI